MTTQEIYNECVKIFSSVDLEFNNIEIKINGRLTKTLGRCCYEVQGSKLTPIRLEFSRLVIEKGDSKLIEDVIKHECAHAIATIETGEKQSHNMYFKSVCARIGTTNDTPSTVAKYNAGDAEIYKYIINCEKCKKVVGKYHRAGNVVKMTPYYRCSNCGGSLKVTQNF